MTLTDELQNLRRTDPDVSLMLDLFEETSRVYREAQEAMARRPRTSFNTTSSSNIVLSVQPSNNYNGHLFIKRK